MTRMAGRGGSLLKSHGDKRCVECPIEEVLHGEGGGVQRRDSAGGAAGDL